MGSNNDGKGSCLADVGAVTACTPDKTTSSNEAFHGLVTEKADGRMRGEVKNPRRRDESDKERAESQEELAYNRANTRGGLKNMLREFEAGELTDIEERALKRALTEKRDGKKNGDFTNPHAADVGVENTGQLSSQRFGEIAPSSNPTLRR